MDAPRRFDSRFEPLISSAQSEAERLGQDFIGTEHLLLAVLREEKSRAASILRDMSLEYEWLLGRLRDQRSASSESLKKSK